MSNLTLEPVETEKEGKAKKKKEMLQTDHRLSTVIC